MQHAAGTTHVIGHHRARRASRGLSATESAILAFVALALVCAALLSGGGSPAGVERTRIRVEAGQTLWELASEHPVAGLSTAQTADLIAEMNDLAQGQPLHAGRTLDVPASVRDGAVASR